MSWGLIDQAISSLTNFAVGIVVAHNFGLEEFGAFTLAWFTYGLILNISRGLATDPLVVRFSGVPVGAWHTAVSRTSATAIAVGVVMGAALPGRGDPHARPDRRRTRRGSASCCRSSWSRTAGGSRSSLPGRDTRPA